MKVGGNSSRFGFGTVEVFLALVGFCALACDESLTEVVTVTLVCEQDQLSRQGCGPASCLATVSRPGTELAVRIETAANGELLEASQALADEAGEHQFYVSCREARDIRAVVNVVGTDSREQAVVDCSEFGAAWEITELTPSERSVRPGEYIEVIAQTSGCGGDAVPPGAAVEFTCATEMGGFGSGYVQRRVDSADGLGRAGVTFGARPEASNDEVIIEAVVRSSLGHETSGRTTVIIDADWSN